MSRGGARPGAGRPKGIRNKLTRKRIAKVARQGPMPLDVMIEAMNEHYRAGRKDQAAMIAEKAAPYLHPRLQAIQHTGKDGGPMEHRDVSEPVNLDALAERYKPKPRLNGKGNGHATNGSGNGGGH